MRDIGKESSGQEGYGKEVEGYRRGGIQERRDAGQENAGKAGFRTRGKLKRINAKQEEYRLDAGLEGCRKGGMQVGMSTIINVL